MNISMLLLKTKCYITIKKDTVTAELHRRKQVSLRPRKDFLFVFWMDIKLTIVKLKGVKFLNNISHKIGLLL